MIVAIKKACRSARSLLRHVFLKTGRMGREVPPLLQDGDRIVGVINGLEVGAVTRSPATDAKSLCSEVPKTRAQLRHVVLSLEDMRGQGDRTKAFEALADLSEQWIEKYAPGSAFIGVLHDDRAHPHCHLLVANSNPFAGDDRLHWKPSTLKEMQSLEWVAPATAEKFSLSPGRHNGLTKREGSGTPYPAASLDAAILAQATNQQIEHYEKSNLLTIGRRNKHGEVTSIVFNGRKIRLSTIRAMAQNQKPDHSPRDPVRRNPRRSRGIRKHSPTVSHHI